MQRRDFMLKTAASLAVAGLSIAGCTTTATTTATPGTADSDKRRHDIDASASATLSQLETTVKGSHELIAKASGVLVFPSVIAAGFGIGGQYGEGALRVHNAAPEYYSLGSLSVGLQIGAQSKAIIFLFMTKEALDKFRASEGWRAGADASVAVLKVGANGNLDVGSASGPVMAFVLTNAGLMANLTLEGTKITHLKI
jgi:lipid-binding SYLF domain-containing protein